MLLRICTSLLCFATLAAGKSKPLDILFLLDVSQNMSGPTDFVIAGARLATFELGQSDRVAVVTFSSGPKTRVGFTGDGQKIEKAFGNANRTVVRLSGKVRLYDALCAAIDQFPAMPDPNRKRVIAVITNDVDRGSTRGPTDVIREAKTRGVAIWGFLIASPYARRFQQKNGHPGVPYPDVHAAAQQLEPVAGATGGKVSIRDPNGYVLREAIAACKGEE